jgi:hypothetical protein
MDSSSYESLSLSAQLLEQIIIKTVVHLQDNCDDEVIWKTDKGTIKQLTKELLVIKNKLSQLGEIGEL